MYKGKEVCEDCIYYKMIDSGYGRCVRFPPQWITKTKVRWVVGVKIKKEEIYCKYPEVEWTNTMCGEFKLNH